DVARQPQVEELGARRRVFLVGDEGPFDDRGQTRQQVLDEVAKDLILALEVLIEGALGAAGAGDDVVDARRLEPVPYELGLGGGEELDLEVGIDGTRHYRLASR